MTEQYEQYVGGEASVYERGAATPMEPVPVKDMSERVTPQMVSCMTWQIPQIGTGQPVQILQRRIHRSKAKITVSFWGTATSIVFSPKLDTVQGATPQGCQYFPIAAASQFLPDWENQKPLYAIAIGGTGALVAVQDEAYSS